MIIPFSCPQCNESITGELTPNNQQTTCSACKETVTIPQIGITSGVTIGSGFLVGDKIGDGSMGNLYRGKQVSMQRDVQIKILPPKDTTDEETMTRFQREVALTASLQHPNMLSAIDAGQDNGIWYLVTEYADGDSLEAYLSKKGSLSEQDALKLLEGVADALRYAWEEKKVLHRNVKPNNMIIVDGGERCLLADLGIAKSLEEKNDVNLTGVGFTVGTPEFMSPEQVRGDADVDFRADMYSLGIVLYRAVVGSLPFADDSPLIVMNKQMDEKPVPPRERNKSVSKACSDMIMRMLEKDRNSRYTSWDAAIKTMNGLMTGETKKQPEKQKPRALQQKVALRRVKSRLPRAKASPLTKEAKAEEGGR